MKPSELQKEIIELVISQAKFWMNTNDINSPTHFTDNFEEVEKFVCEDKISDTKAEDLVNALDNLYRVIRDIDHGKKED